MKILFVYTDINTMGLGAISYHFGLGILSAVLKKQGHTTKLFYAREEAQLSNQIVKVAREFGPDIIALTSNTPQIAYVKSVIHALQYLKDCFVVLGGCHASLYPNCLFDIKRLDAICIGEGEETIVELVKSLGNKYSYEAIRGLWVKRANGEVIKNTGRPFIPSIDSLPFSDYELFGYQKVIDSDFGRVSFMLSRGCPFSCTYCASPTLGKLQEGRYVRFMSPERAMDELKFLKSRYQFKTIFFADDTFTVNKQFVIDFCEKYKKEINLPFEINARVETISSNMLEALKKAGCFKIHMGIEHGNQNFRRNVLNRQMSNEQIVTAFNMVKESGMATKTYNIVGFPMETEDLHKDTVNLNKQINPDSHVCYIFQPYPGTKLYEICKEKEFFDEDYFLSETISRRDTVLNLPAFSRKKILKCHRDFSYQIYKDKSWRKALIYKLYYSRYGEKLVRLFSPVKDYLRNLAMKG